MAYKPKDLAEFQRKHDPMFQHDAAISPVYNRQVKWSKGTRRAIVVAAQNATPAHKDFWAVLNHMAETLNAELFVLPLRYKNPTSIWTGSQQDAEWYANEFRPYLWNQPLDLNDGVMVLGDIRVQPTNSNPLGGADALSRGKSCVVGHTRAQSKSVAMMNAPAPFLMTSGAATVANYSDTRVGRLGHFHHSLSAVLIEVKGERFTQRRLNYSEHTQRVIDMGVAYYADRHETAPPSLALIMGDTHVDYVCGTVVAATFGNGGIVERTRPQHLLWHDLLDGDSCNPHHAQDPFADIAKYIGGRGSVNGETTRAIDFVRGRTAEAKKATGNTVKSVLVPSNHLDFLARWIAKSDWKVLPPENRAFYLRTALMIAESAGLDDAGINYVDPFTELFRRANIPDAIALDSGDSFKLGGVELAMHFDKGPNGSKGSLKNLRRVASKSVGGHSHSPGEDEGATQVGTSTRLRLSYNKGSPSSWLNAHCDLNADGKRQLVIIRDGDFAL